MKPYWKDAPLWARWLAQDYSGIWYWYAENAQGFRKTLEKRPK